MPNLCLSLLLTIYYYVHFIIITFNLDFWYDHKNKFGSLKVVHSLKWLKITGICKTKLYRYRNVSWTDKIYASLLKNGYTIANKIT